MADCDIGRCRSLLADHDHRISIIAMKTVIIMPAYYAERTLAATLDGLPSGYRDIILCDDASRDGTYDLAKQLGLPAIRHATNRGYGGNQKTLFSAALAKNPDLVVMVHPDNQYDTACIPTMAAMFMENPQLGLVIGSRMKSAVENNMPRWKYVSNRSLTICQNAVFGTRLSEFHSGLRAYRASVLAGVPYETFSEGFVFDSEIIAWLVSNRYQIGEVDTECHYTAESSSLGFPGSVKYGLQTLGTLAKYLGGAYHRRDEVS
jgi:glycosyltransferase involved in cell wall biosynthesis